MNKEVSKHIKDRLIKKRKRNISLYEKYKADWRVRIRRKWFTRIVVDLSRNIKYYEDEIKKWYEIIKSLTD